MVAEITLWSALTELNVEYGLESFTQIPNATKMFCVCYIVKSPLVSSFWFCIDIHFRFHSIKNFHCLAIVCSLGLNYRILQNGQASIEGGGFSPCLN